MSTNWFPKVGRLESVAFTIQLIQLIRYSTDLFNWSLISNHAMGGKHLHMEIKQLPLKKRIEGKDFWSREYWRNTNHEN